MRQGQKSTLTPGGFTARAHARAVFIHRYVHHMNQNHAHAKFTNLCPSCALPTSIPIARTSSDGAEGAVRHVHVTDCRGVHFEITRPKVSAGVR